MKRFVVPFLLSVSLIVGAMPIASASITPGTKCLKVGAKQTFKGKIYTCVKSGKSQIWNKGMTPSQAVPSATPTPKASATTSPTPTIQDKFSASSDFWSRGPSSGDERISSYVNCNVAKPLEYQAINSFISIFDPLGNLLARERLSDIYRPIDFTGYGYTLNFNEVLKNSGKTYSCLFEFVRLDGSQVKKELPINVPSIIKSPLPKPKTEIYSIASGGNYEVGCFLTNWEDYSLGKWKYISAEAGSIFEPTSKVTLIRDDGSVVATSGLNFARSGLFFYLIPSNLSNYNGVYLDQQMMYGEIDRASGKRYSCKYEMVGFNGETLVHTEIVQMPTRYIPPTPTPSPAPIVTPGAFCATAGAIGKSTNGTSYTCKTSDTDTRYRWRQ